MVKVLHVVDKVLLSELSSMHTCLVGSNWEGAFQEYTLKCLSIGTPKTINFP